MIVSSAAYLRCQLTGGIDLETAGDHASSRAEPSTGFTRGIARISLIARS